MTPKPTLSIILSLQALTSIIADFDKTEMCNLGLNTRYLVCCLSSVIVMRKRWMAA